MESPMIVIRPQLEIEARSYMYGRGGGCRIYSSVRIDKEQNKYMVIKTIPCYESYYDNKKNIIQFDGDDENIFVISINDGKKYMKRVNDDEDGVIDSDDEAIDKIWLMRLISCSVM